MREPNVWEPVPALGAAVFDLVEFGSVYVERAVDPAELQACYPRRLEVKMTTLGARPCRFVRDTGEPGPAAPPHRR